jgi:hypothetical protein
MGDVLPEVGTAPAAEPNQRRKKNGGLALGNPWNPKGGTSVEILPQMARRRVIFLFPAGVPDGEGKTRGRPSIHNWRIPSRPSPPKKEKGPPAKPEGLQ